MNKSAKISLRQIIITGLFAAICYVALYFKIPVPSPVGNPFLHLGNMFVLLAAMLFGGMVGGLSGSIGMGLFDIMNGWASSALKTFVLKFGIGIVTGVVVSRGKRDGAKSPVKAIALASVVALILGCSILIIRILYGNQIVIGESTLVISPVLYLFTLIIGVFLAVIAIVSKKLKIDLQYAVLGASAGIGFNLVGEFLFGAIKLMLLGSAAIPAMLSSAISLPATLINGTFSIAGAIALYLPLSRATQRAGLRF